MLHFRGQCVRALIMAATQSMAAAIAASLPAPQAAPTPAAPTYEAIPASMSKAIDIEADIPLTCVQLDGMVSNSFIFPCFHAFLGWFPPFWGSPTRPSIHPCVTTTENPHGNSYSLDSSYMLQRILFSFICLEIRANAKSTTHCFV